MKDQIVKTLFINAAREIVWDYLIDKDKLGQWFHAGQNTLENGKPYNLLGDSGEPILGGDVLEMDPPSKLVYTFTHEWLGGKITTVTWELTEAYGGTRIFLTHSGFDAADNAMEMLLSHDNGWEEHFARLRGILNPKED